MLRGHLNVIFKFNEKKTPRNLLIHRDIESDHHRSMNMKRMNMKSYTNFDLL